jgi:hypothetical protein
MIETERRRHLASPGSRHTRLWDPPSCTCLLDPSSFARPWDCCRRTSTSRAPQVTATMARHLGSVVATPAALPQGTAVVRASVGWGRGRSCIEHRVGGFTIDGAKK